MSSAMEGVVFGHEQPLAPRVAGRKRHREEQVQCEREAGAHEQHIGEENTSSIVVHSDGAADVVCHIDDLPDDVLAYVFSFVVRRDWIRLAPVVPLGFGEVPAADDINLDLLAKFFFVSKRWRCIAQSAPFWGRVCLRAATDRTLGGLLALPAERLAPVRSFYLKFPHVGRPALELMAQRLAHVAHIELDFEHEETASLPLAHLGALARMTRLRSVELSISEKTLLGGPLTVASAPVQAALASFASLPLLEALLLQNLPLDEASLSRLTASRSLQRSLRVLHLDAFLPPVGSEREGSPGPAIAALAPLCALRELAVAFRDPVNAEWVGPRAEGHDLRPLGALTELALLDVGAYCASVEHLLGMRSLSDVVILLDPDADAGLLLRDGPPAFRRLAVVAGCGQDEWGFPPDPSAPPQWAPSLVPFVTSLSRLEMLQLHGPGAMLAAVAEARLSGLASLAELRVNNDEEEDAAGSHRIPLSLVRRAASELPALTSLRLDSPLPPPAEAVPALAAFAGRPLRRLLLASRTLEELRASEAAFAALRAALPGVLIDEARPECGDDEEDESAADLEPFVEDDDDLFAALPAAAANAAAGPGPGMSGPIPVIDLDAEDAFDAPPHPPEPIEPPPPPSPPIPSFPFNMPVIDLDPPSPPPAAAVPVSSFGHA